MDWQSHIWTFLAGLVSGYTVKTVISIRSSKTKRVNKVNQHGNFAGGDIVGGDVNKSDRP
jgi:hypothetical protein